VLADQRLLDGGDAFRGDGLLAVELMRCGRGSRGVMLGVRVSAGGATMDAGSESWDCRDGGGENESKRGTEFHADMYL
jgi:hypothetical protein